MGRSSGGGGRSSGGGRSAGTTATTATSGGDVLSSSIKRRIEAQQSMPEMSLEDVRVKRQAGEAIANDIRQSLNGRTEPGIWLRDGAFQLARFEDFGVSDAQLASRSTVRAFYREMSNQFHPDKGGTAEQMANLNRLRSQMDSIVRINS